jgi:hypothetical protein
MHGSVSPQGEAMLAGAATRISSPLHQKMAAARLE